jgi:hypothetical protein
MRPWNLPYNEPIYLLDGNSSIFEDEILDLYMHSGTLESLLGKMSLLLTQARSSDPKTDACTIQT